MALTSFQRLVCRAVAAGRRAAGERYLAGGSALNELLRAPRRSHDIDLFHDSAEALRDAWATDRAALSAAGFDVISRREFPTFVEAIVRQGEESTVLQWSHDSAYRFFPLVEHADLGLTLHPFDLATNKVLALVGRVEPRDWIDAMTCHDRVQPLGCLAWAASGKDPGLSPGFILDQARRTVRYSRDELAELEFDEEQPDIGALTMRWREMLAQADALIGALPAAQVGCCVTTMSGELFRGGVEDLRVALGGGQVRFHAGCIRGAWPEFLPPR